MVWGRKRRDERVTEALDLAHDVIGSLRRVIRAWRETVNAIPFLVVGAGVVGFGFALITDDHGSGFAIEVVGLLITLPGWWWLLGSRRRESALWRDNVQMLRASLLLLAITIAFSIAMAFT